MKLKTLFVVVLCLIGLSGQGIADDTGVYTGSLSCTGLDCGTGGYTAHHTYYTDSNDGINYNYSIIITYTSESSSGMYSRVYTYEKYTGGQDSLTTYLYDVGDQLIMTGVYGDNGEYLRGLMYANSAGDNYVATVVVIIVSPSLLQKFWINGTTDCISTSTLYIKNSTGEYDIAALSTGNTYNFSVHNTLSYRLMLDTHAYDFTVDGSNIVYDYDGCSHTRYRFEESCNNLIPNSDGFYTEYTGMWGLPKFFCASGGILDIVNSSASKNQIFTTPFFGIAGWIIDPVTTDTEYILTNPNINWGLKVIVKNGSDGTLIDNAMVQVQQGCYCCTGTSTRQKMTVSGMAGFVDMSLQDASLLVMKSGYKPIDENSTGYSAFLSGRANFSSKTWICKLAPSWSNNSSSFYEVNNTVGIHFVDESGNRTSKIDDTDSEVYLYYENNNTEGEAMTMRFEASSTHTYFMPELQWTIAHDDIGSKTIANSYFTPWDYSYRAVIYNSSIYGWNLTIPLTVRNATKEEEAHYENLSTSIFFMYAHDGKIDHRDTMRIGIHACSNNTTLMSTDIELWKDGVYLCHKNLTESDYTGASFPYYYIWCPVYDYTSESNYSVRMYGFDRTLLETDYVECITDSTTRKNKLTIGVKDRSGTNLGNCYIYLEGWGSLPTGSLYYNAYEGIDNGDYRYKASKLGYTSSGWIDVTIEDNDKIVWYTLIDNSESGAPTQTKMSDDDIKGFFLPLMFMLLICILLGGLRYAAN